MAADGRVQRIDTDLGTGDLETRSSAAVAYFLVGS
jgi:hypothetical protein